MSFVRIKNIKDNEYAYLINNRWLKTRKQPKQKVIGYLGKVIRPELNKEMGNTSFFDFKKIHEPDDYAVSRKKENILKDLIEFELARHDVNIEFDFDKPSFMVNNRNVVLKINDGFMCNYTVKMLKEMDAKGEEEEIGLELAKGFVNAGIAVPREIFIEYFSKVFK